MNCSNNYGFWMLVCFVNFMLSCNSPKKESNVPEDSTTAEINYKDSLENYISINQMEPVVWDEKRQVTIEFNDELGEKKAKAKFRGGLSSKYHKHSFTISLDSNLSLYNGWKADDDYILNASYIDKSFLRHKLSYDLFASFSEENIAPKSEYEHLFFNGIYQGLYLVIEKVDKSLLNISKLDTKAYLLKDGALFIKDTSSFKAQLGENKYHIKIPKSINESHTSELDKLYNFIHHSSNKEFAEQVDKLFNLNVIIDWHILIMLTNNNDGVIKNFYWFKDENRKWTVVPWDYDDSFGRNGDNTLQDTSSTWQHNTLLNRLFKLNVDNYKKQVAKRWRTLRKDKLSADNLYHRIDIMVEELTNKNVHLNFRVWPVDSEFYSDNYIFDQEVELIKAYCDIKLSELDSIYSKWETL